MKNKFITILTSCILIVFSSCNKNKSCYDEKMYLQHKDDICTMDCPGVKGCDGENYCNECVANAKGIAVEK